MRRRLAIAGLLLWLCGGVRAIAPPVRLLRVDFRRPCGYASGIFIRRMS